MIARQDHAIIGVGPIASFKRAVAVARWQDIALQAAILITSAIGASLVAMTPVHPLHRWGYLILASAQPLWLYDTARRGQWGMFAVAIFYTGTWVHGTLIRFT